MPPKGAYCFPDAETLGPVVPTPAAAAVSFMLYLEAQQIRILQALT